MSSLIIFFIYINLCCCHPIHNWNLLCGSFQCISTAPLLLLLAFVSIKEAHQGIGFLSIPLCTLSTVAVSQRWSKRAVYLVNTVTMSRAFRFAWEYIHYISSSTGDLDHVWNSRPASPIQLIKQLYLACKIHMFIIKPKSLVLQIPQCTTTSATERTAVSASPIPAALTTVISGQWPSWHISSLAPENGQTKSTLWVVTTGERQCTCLLTLKVNMCA